MKKKFSILFRTSGGSAAKKELGLGHIFRCVNIAKSLKKHEIHFLIEDYGSVKQILKNNGFSNVSVLKPGLSLNEDIKSSINLIEKNQIQIIIVDKYKTKKQYLKEIKKSIPVIYISDLNLIKYPCDILVNGFIGYENKIIKNKNQTILLGPKFQILNSQFSKSKNTEKKYNILATFGGYDESKILEYFLESLSFIPTKLKIRCILGSASKSSQKFQSIQKMSHHNISIIHHTDNMKKEIEKCEFGFCSGGITSYEFAALNVPFAIIAQNKHQLLTAGEWEKSKFSINLGLSNKKNQIKLIELLKKISKKDIPKFTKCTLIDGLGTIRITKTIKKFLSDIY